MSDTSKVYADAEYAVLGALIIDPGLVAHEIFSRVQPEDFIHGICRRVFEAARDMYNRDDTIDRTTLSAVLGDDARAFVGELNLVTPSARNCSAYIDILLDWSKRHRVQEIAAQLSGLCAVGAPIEELLAGSEQISEVLASGTEKDTFTLPELICRFMERLDRPRRYLDWGFDKLNQFIFAEYGESHGSLLVIGARPSTGKTAFALNAALAMAQHNRVMFFSYETGRDGIAERIETSESNVDFGRIKRGQTDAEDLTQFIRQQKRLGALPFQLVEATGKTVDAIRARARRNKADVVFIDYLQLVECAGAERLSEYERTTRVSRSLQKLARSGICVIALSQLSRSEEGGIRALRGSGQIEQDADVVMMLEHPNKDILPEGTKEIWDEVTREQKERLRVLRIAKNRDGRCGDIFMRFDGAHQRFAVGWPDFLVGRGLPPKEFTPPKPAQVSPPAQQKMKGT